MNEPRRPDPDALLARARRLELSRRRGRLKLFLGMAAGVGKTYAMLKAARELNSRGVDVVVGFVETHGRKETEALLEGLRVVPRLSIMYRGIEIFDMDLDEILRRKPDYVLVDELAHTNAEGMRHKKRYQDVAELIDRGINVFTTLNVQHVESLVDTVRQISGIAIRETVPDSLIDAADEIELIDLPPDDLLARLAEGKVYTADRSAEAVKRFFRKGNLTALREIALRTTARRVGSQLQDYMQEHDISGPWKTVERLMVAVGPSPYSELLIRWTRRIAATMEAPWIAVYVRTTRRLAEGAERRLKKNIALAQELGGRLIATTDDDIVQALIRTARQNNVTQIVVGKSMTNSLIDAFHGGSLVNRLIAESGDIDIYVVQGEKTAETTKGKPTLTLPGVKSPLFHYAVSGLAVIGTALACQAVAPIVDYRSIGMFLLFVIALLSLFVGKGPVFFASLVGATIWDFFFIPPRFTFTISQISDIFLLSLFFIIAAVTGTLTARVRAQQGALWRRERQAAALYSLTSELSSAETIDDVANTAIRRISAEFEVAVAWYAADSGADLAREPHPSSGFKPDTQKEWAVAEWVFKNRKPAGHDAATLPFAKAVYYPVLSDTSCLGVIGIVPAPGHALTFEKETFFHMFLRQIANSLDRLYLRSERLNKTLLRSISHELRTPLAVITSASSGLSDPVTGSDPGVREILLGDIRGAARRLNWLMENFLNMSRLESGVLSVHREWCDVGDLCESVLERLRHELSGHRVQTRIGEDMPLFELDAALVDQAVFNLLLNATQYTPESSTIVLAVEYAPDTLTITVEDDGPGIPPESLPRIFEKFFRVPGAKPGGTGLGLSIVKGFAESLGGTVEASNRPSGGARFSIRLPAASKTIPVDKAE